MLLWIIKCRAIAGLLRPNLLFLVNSIKMSVRTPYSFTVPPPPVFLKFFLRFSVSSGSQPPPSLSPKGKRKELEVFPHGPLLCISILTYLLILIFQQPITTSKEMHVIKDSLDDKSKKYGSMKVLNFNN